MAIAASMQSINETARKSSNTFLKTPRLPSVRCLRNYLAGKTRIVLALRKEAKDGYSLDGCEEVGVYFYIL